MRSGIVAVDPALIPLRNQVYVPGYGIGDALDTGGGIRSRRIDLAYEDVGPTDDDAPDAAPLVWGHGLSRSVAEDDQFPMIDWQRIRRTRRVVRFDARGHGESGPLASPVDGAWDQLALDELGLIDALGIDQVVLGGASRGTARRSPRLA